MKIEGAQRIVRNGNVYRSRESAKSVFIFCHCSSRAFLTTLGSATGGGEEGMVEIYQNDRER